MTRSIHHMKLQLQDPHFWNPECCPLIARCDDRAVSPVGRFPVHTQDSTKSDHRNCKYDDDADNLLGDMKWSDELRKPWPCLTTNGWQRTTMRSWVCIQEGVLGGRPHWFMISQVTSSASLLPVKAVAEIITFGFSHSHSQSKIVSGTVLNRDTELGTYRKNLWNTLPHSIAIWLDLK